ncbi:MAG TPA: hypothetical protein VGR89_02185 [Puia sp.]|nr:hypothetical protein [Puia sp.]
MKRALLIISLFTGGWMWSTGVSAQSAWPRSISFADGAIAYVNVLVPDSLRDDILSFRAAFAVIPKGSRDTLYGSFRALAVISVNRNDRTFTLRSANILTMQLTQLLPSDTLDIWKDALECGLPGAEGDVPLDELLACDIQAFNVGPQQSLGHFPPRIIFVQRPTALVQIDGIPQFRRHRQWNIGVVANSPNTIIESDNSWYYLYGGRHWYIAPMPEGPFTLTTEMIPAMRRVMQATDADNRRGAAHLDMNGNQADIPKDVVITLVPSELIQSRGLPALSPIPGTNLKYINNSDNDIFLDTATHEWYVLLSGRWYRSNRLQAGAWSYVSPDLLPADFKGIPEGSVKDNVLASVPGTEAAREAVIDACIPQTARLLRSTTTSGPRYDVGPKFLTIAGTALQYAINASLPVFHSRSNYYCVDHGVWFTAASPSGPWHAALSRPQDIDLIPVDCPMYYCRFVFVYGYDKEYIYTGYTVGYLNAYIDGQTLVYGTGYSHEGWVGSDYFPEPRTWGFGVRYNPWFGWCFGTGDALEWLNNSVAWGGGYWSGGWWGPPGYRPAHIWHPFRGQGTYQWNISLQENVNYNNDLYRTFRDPAAARAPALLFPDPEGSVCRPGRGGGWEWRREDQWVPVSDSLVVARLNRQFLMEARSRMRQQNFLQQWAAGEWTTEKKEVSHGQ